MDDMIMKAARLAALLHSGQQRKWGLKLPYVVHPMRVAGMVSMHPNATPEMIAAAWLHDAVEDARDPVAAKRLIQLEVGDDVLRLVDELTNASKESEEVRGKPRAERKAMDRQKLVQASWEARYIKLSDRIDNLEDMVVCTDTPADFMKLYKQESKLLAEALLGTDFYLEKRIEELTR